MSDPLAIISPTVIAELPSWFKQPEIEGFVSHPYCDDGGVVTGGSGLAFFSPQEMCVIGWQLPDGSKASAGAIWSAYNACKSMWFKGCDYAAEHYTNASNLFISDAENTAGILRWFSHRMLVIESFFPEFVHYRDGVQLGILEMAFNMGPACFKGYPRFMSHIKALDWAGAASECATLSGPKKRNELRAALFLRDESGTL